MLCRLILLLLLASASLLEGEETKIRIRLPSETPDQNAEEEDPDREIRSGRTVLRPWVNGKPALKFRAGTLAGRLGVPEREICWNPALQAGNAASLRLREVVQTPDRSLLIFPEETASGTRILLFDSANWLFLHLLEVPEKILQIVPDRSSLRCACLVQTGKDRKEEVVFLDLKSGNLSGRTTLPAGTSMLAWSSHACGIFLCTSSGQVFLLNNGTRTRLPELQNILFLTQTPDGKTILAAGKTDFFLLDAASGEILRHASLPGGKRPLNAAFPGPDARKILLTLQHESGTLTGTRCSILLVTEHGTKELAPEAAGPAAADYSGNSVYVPSLERGRVLQIQLKDGKTLSYCAPLNLKPVSRGYLRFLFASAEPGELVCVDSTGGICRVRLVRKKWKKTDLLKP